MPVEVARQPPIHHPSPYAMQPHGYHYPTTHAAQYPPIHAYPGYPAVPGMQHRPLPPDVQVAHIHVANNKRLAPPHPAESPAKKKQSKWGPEEDASIIELRGNGMKWEDISKHLPGRSAISCRLRFQNYLERRAEWDEEKKNKLARLYERFKKDMWEKIAKEMQLPWRAAENMHWQIGEVEMAQRANVPVFHTAGQSGPGPDRDRDRTPRSVSPPHTHNHSLPQLEMRERRNSAGAEANGVAPGPLLLRRRADSARAVPTLGAGRPLLPPLGEVAGPAAQHGGRYTAPLPVGSSLSGERR